MQHASSRRPCTAWHSYTAIQRYTLYTHTAIQRYTVYTLYIIPLGETLGFGKVPTTITQKSSESQMRPNDLELPRPVVAQ
eukprot:scaffold128275_cov27-Phaeocystis_antarctica.AAC.2